MPQISLPPYTSQLLLQDDFPLPLDLPFTTRQALAAGLTHRALRRLTEEGLLRRPIRGVYVAAQLPDSRVLRGQILERVAPPGSVVTDWTACWYWTSIDRPNADIEEPRISVFRFRGHERLRNALVSSGERWLTVEDVEPIGGSLFVTTPIRTAWDLGRFSAPVIALGGMDALKRLGVFGDEFVYGVERFRRQRGVVQLRVLAPLVDGRSESPGESALRWRWLQTPGLPSPELQVPVYNEYGEAFRWIDLGLEELRFGAEYDGEAFHNEQTREHDESRRSELDLHHDWTIEVFVRADVFGQHQNASGRLLTGVRGARVRRGTFRTTR